MGAFSRSWGLTKTTFRIIGQDKELLLFPLIAFVLSVGWIAAMLIPTIGVQISREETIEWNAVEIAVSFITYLGLAFIATFGKFCVAFTTKTRLEGGNASFGESIGFAFRRLRQILAWSVIVATVGLILRSIDRASEKSGGAAAAVLSVLRSFLELAWNVVTLFVVPSMVYANHGPVDALKDSVSVLKQRWGESLVKHLGFGMIQFLVMLAGGLVTAGLFFLMHEGQLIWVPIGFLVVFVIGTALVFSVADTVFYVALYEYAVRDRVPRGWDQEFMDEAFRSS
jgi:hypothetical protein